MLDKQLNFLDIFDRRPQDKDLEKKEVQKNEENLENIENFSGEKQDNIIDAQGLVILRQILSQSFDELSLNDFADFKAELANYEQRYLSFKKEYQDFDKNIDPHLLESSQGREKARQEKEELYKKIVFPQTKDLPKYRDIAKLYIKYKDFLKEEAKRKSRINRYNQDSKKKIIKQKKRSSKIIPKFNKITELAADEEYDEDSPDPWGDIYPFGQARRKKKE